MAGEHVDVLIVGAGISGVGGAYHLTTAPNNVRRPGGAGELRRHVAAPTAIPASAPTATCTPSATASSRGPAPPIATAAEILKYMGEVIEENDLARHIRYRHRISAAELVERRQPLDDRGEAHRHRRSDPLHRQLPLDVPGLLPALRGLHAGVAGHGRGSTGRSSIRRPGRRTSTTAASACWSSARAPRRRPRAGHRRRQRARHHAAALADLLLHRHATRSRSPTSCASCRSTRAGSTRSSAQDPLRAGRVTRSSFDEPERWPTSCSALCGTSSARTTTWTALHAALPALAAAARLRSRRRPVPAIAAGKASVVTDEIETFTETGILLKSGGELEADIIVTATGFHLACSATSTSRSTASRWPSPTPSPTAA